LKEVVESWSGVAISHNSLGSDAGIGPVPAAEMAKSWRSTDERLNWMEDSWRYWRPLSPQLKMPLKQCTQKKLFKFCSVTRF